MHQVGQELECVDRGRFAQPNLARLERVVEDGAAVLPDPDLPPLIGFEGEAVDQWSAGPIAAVEPVGQVAQVGPGPVTPRWLEAGVLKERPIVKDDLGVVVAWQPEVATLVTAELKQARIEIAEIKAVALDEGIERS